MEVIFIVFICSKVNSEEMEGFFLRWVYKVSFIFFI